MSDSFMVANDLRQKALERILLRGPRRVPSVKRKEQCKTCMLFRSEDCTDRNPYYKKAKSRACENYER